MSRPPPAIGFVIAPTPHFLRGQKHGISKIFIAAISRQRQRRQRRKNMAGVNKVIIIGRLGRDPELRNFQNGTPVANFPVATSEQWTDKQTGEKKEKTEWHRIVAFGRLAEICGQYLAKGKQVYIEGRLQTREWEDRDGITRYTTEIVASNMQMLGSRQDTAQGGYQPGAYPAPGDMAGQGGGYQPPPQPQAEEDEIPF